MDKELLTNLTQVLSELQRSVEGMNQAVQQHQQRVDALASSQIILFQLLVRHCGIDLAELIPELEQYVAKTPSVATRDQLQFHLKACQQVAEMMRNT